MCSSLGRMGKLEGSRFTERTGFQSLLGSIEKQNASTLLRECEASEKSILQSMEQFR